MTAQVFINSLAAICGSRKCIYRVTFLIGVGTNVAARILKLEIHHPYKFALQTEHHGQQRWCKTQHTACTLMVTLLQHHLLVFFSFMPFIETKTLLSWYQGWAEFINVCNPRVSEGITALLHILPSYGGPPALQRRNVTLHLQFKIKTDECIKKKIFQFYSKPSIYFSF